jgi:hypothetical protein
LRRAQPADISLAGLFDDFLGAYAGWTILGAVAAEKALVHSLGDNLAVGRLIPQILFYQLNPASGQMRLLPVDRERGAVVLAVSAAGTL